MKRTYLVVGAVAVSLALIESANAYPRGGGGRSFGGGGRSFGGGGSHYSGGSFRSSAGSYRSSAASFRPSASSYRPSATTRSYSPAAGRYYGPRNGAMPNNRNFNPNRPRVSPTSTGVRNPTYANGRRFDGNRTTAFNSQNFTRSRDRVMAGNTSAASRSQAFNRNRGNIVARHSGNWRNWNRNRDHYWNGHRCHFHGGYWYVYDPFPFYPYWGYYPYYDYYPYYEDPAYYDSAYATNEPAPAAYTDQSQYADSGRVTEIQRALARAGYYDGAIDGVIGPGTRNALRRYQRDHGLSATGQIDGAVIEALRSR